MLWIKTGAIFMLFAVMLGAFGAHALKSRLDSNATEIYKTAVLYHALHALGLIVLGILSQLTSDPKVSLSAIFILFGIILFSGSLYLLSLTGHKWLGAITPLGGVSFLIGWILIMFIRQI